MTQPNWEDVEVPRGAYIGWGLRAGQHVTGVVLEYAPTGGVDFNQNVCPALAIELVENAWSADKAQNYTEHRAGDLVQLNCGQVSLKRAVHAADPSPGDLVKITLENILAGAGKQGGDVKEFGIKIVRGFRPQAARSHNGQSQPQSAPNFGTPPQQAYSGPPQGQPQPPQPNFGGQQQAPQFGGPQQPQAQPSFAQQQPQGAPWGNQGQQAQAPQGQPQFAPAGAPSVPATPPFGAGADQAPPF